MMVILEMGVGGKEGNAFEMANCNKTLKRRFREKNIFIRSLRRGVLKFSTEEILAHLLRESFFR